MRDKLADAIDANGHIPYKINRFELHNSPYLIILTEPDGKIIAGCSIKYWCTEIAEIGYMLVANPYRRLGIGQALVQKRISIARESGIRILYGMVREPNRKSRLNLEKAGFRPEGRIVCRVDSTARIVCYAKTLRPISEQRRQSLLREAMRDRVEAIY